MENFENIKNVWIITKNHGLTNLLFDEIFRPPECIENLP